MVTSKNSFKDRSVKSTHSPETEQITIEVLKECVLKGVVLSVGTRFTVSRVEAKNLIKLDSKTYKPVLD